MSTKPKDVHGVIDALRLPRWRLPAKEGEAPTPETKLPGSKFPFDPKMNSKLALWSGDLTRLDIGAVVCTTNERLSDRSGVAGRIHSRAGRHLAQECRSGEICHTGDAIITKGHRLPASNVIHTVGPRFSVKYLTAAENALHSCYRRCLELAVEAKVTSLAFCVINTEAKGYPKEQAAHVAIRTIRRFLEKHGEKLEAVVLAMNNETDMAIYNAVLPLYFPRSTKEEKKSIKRLPKDVGNDMGGTVIRERDIRIKGIPTTAPAPTTLEEVKYVASRIGPRPTNTEDPDDPLIDSSLATWQESPDILRARNDSKSPAEVASQAAEDTYRDYLTRAKTADLKELSRFQFIYPSGKDGLGRPVVVFVAAHLPAANVDMDRVLLYVIQLLDPIVSQDFNLVYLHTNIAPNNKPSYMWIRKAYNILNRKYKKNMKNFYIVHPNWWVRALFFFARPFVSSKFWKKLHYVDYLMDMYETFDPKLLKIPDHIIKHDQMINIKYYNAKYAKREQG